MPKDQVSMGASAIHVEDMAGLMTPRQLTTSFEPLRKIDRAHSSPCPLRRQSCRYIAYWEAIKLAWTVLMYVSSMAFSSAHPSPLKAILLPYGERRVTPDWFRTV